MIYGWYLNVAINSKNSFGGYVGKRWWGFFVRNDQILYVFPPAEELPSS